MPKKAADQLPEVTPAYDVYAAAKKAKSIGPDPNARPRTGPSSWLDTAMKYMIGYDADPNWRPGAVDVMAAAIPFIRSIPHPHANMLHSLDEIRNIAAGTGETRLFRGTTADNAEAIMQNGLKLPESGEAAAQSVAKLYGIPWTEWKYRVEPNGVGGNYGSATKRLSTAPYPVASRWGQAGAFPQGEINSQLNAEARLYSEAKRRGVPYDDLYNEAGDAAVAQGTPSMYKYPDAIGAPDKMAPKSKEGAMFQVIVDSRAISPRIRKEAQMYLDGIARGEYTPEQAVKYWNINYQDIKIHPQNIKRLELLNKAMK